MNAPWIAALSVVLCCLTPLTTRAQQAPPAEANQFDFLIGQWELEVTPKVNGLAAAIHGTPRIVGSWKAWRDFDGHGISDELRLMDASGNPVALNSAMRIYDGKSRQWLVQTLDVYRTRFGNSTAVWQNGEMLSNSAGPSPEGKPALTRTRYSGITADRFRVRQDQSTDNGASWDEGVLTILAKRVARSAPR